MQSSWACELLDSAPSGRVLELCAGAGHIGLLTAVKSGRELVAVDVDPTACHFARINAERAGIPGAVEVRESLLNEAMDAAERFALILADPPWVLTTDVGKYPDDPRLAIDGGIDGLRVAMECVDVARRHLMLQGSLLLQLGTEQQCRMVLARTMRSGRWRDGGRRVGAGGVVQRLVRVDLGTTSAAIGQTVGDPG